MKLSIYKVGKLGEDIATRFLVKHGFVVISRNYLKKFGELDIIAKKNGQIHFVEVKTVSCETPSKLHDSYRPEDNISQNKLKRIGRTIQAYLLEFHVKQDWEFHAITVVLDHTSKKAHVRMIENIIINEK